METVNYIHLSYDEYVTLMCMFGAKNLYGTFIDEKYGEMSSGEIENMWDNCKKTLSAKGYIELTDDGVNFNIALYYLLTECVNAKKVFNIQIFSSNKQGFDNTFYLGDKTLISVINNDGMQEVCVCAQNKTNAYKKIYSYIEFALADSQIPDTQQILLSKQEYFSLVAGINTGNIEKMHSILSGKLPKEYESNIISAMTNSHTNISITEYVDGGDMLYAFISSESDFWAISSGDDGNVVFQSISVDEINEIISDLFN